MFQLALLQFWNLTIWVGVVLICYVLYLALDALYNIFLHPLSKFPGPPAAAASHVPYAYAAVRGRLSFWVKSLHDQYDSPVVRISPRELSFISADIWDSVYGKRSSLYLKDKAVYYGRPPNGVHSILTVDRDNHARMRKVLNHAFSDRALREHEPVIEGYVNLLINQLHEQIQGGAAKVNLLDWYSWTAFDIIGDLAFGDKFECLQNQTLHAWVKSVRSALELLVYIGACKRFDLARRVLPFLIPKRVKKMAADNWTSTKEKFWQRMKLGTRRPDFISEILKFNDDKMGLSQEEILSNAYLFVGAGSEPLETVLMGTTFYLLQNPAVMRKLTDEICGAFKSEAELNRKSVSRLPYLVACVNETLRIYPAFLGGSAVVVPSGGETIGNHWVPGGTGVSSNMYAVNRSERNFKDPDIYVPERWLGHPLYASDNRDIFHPFSQGTRNCIGKNLGNLETRLIIAKMIWNFRIELSEETDTDWLDQKSFMSFVKKPLFVKLTPRSSRPTPDTRRFAENR